MDSLLTRLIVPIASEDDMISTCQALTPHLPEETERLVILHVIEKGGGYIDKAPLEARQQQADRIFEIAANCFENQSGFETDLRYGEDIVDTILETVSEVEPTAIAFTPRESNRLTRFLTGDAEHRLLIDSPCPVLAFPEAEDGGYHEVTEN